ncbi:class I SAM-dependent methyltransferase [Flagellimonas meridianipacifica]|uniref:Ubiquinone/menaquinone biosynthesis C-methylase UbiE n=1 Tax=Flagellimonas meridianipacifica TaxID=1080225 RepID=A0A2T0MBD4_9FLAO|nr:class I SAM-dependent methyltransferase [Allomuricauda pacifica]PRX54785.1 ubiquinone/menaquinone biosynthesis C-methylase UbiE [Allomuricauda pacifica]
MMAAKYDKIGIDYNLTRKADPYLTKQLLSHLEPDHNGKYLDIGCGTGNYTHEFQKKGLDFIGIDPSKIMLDKARLRNETVFWKIGSAENTGLPKNFIDGVIASLTIHHWTDLGLAFSELNRVLKPGGRIVIFTSTPKQMQGYWLNQYFPKMLSDSIVQMPSLEKVKGAMEVNGFKFMENHRYFIHPDLENQFLYCGKQNPELYFDKRIRRGISSFSSLSNRVEVEKGLMELRKDIDSGKIEKMVKSYENDFGDYLFVIGKKPTGNNA